MIFRLPLAALMATLLASSTVHAAPPADAQHTLDPLVQVIIARNAIADQVALSKWDSHKAVFDPTREQQLLNGIREKAPDYRLAPADAARFQLGQMEANRLIQYQLLNSWHRKGHAPAIPRTPLTDLRGRLDMLQDQQLNTLSEIASLRPRQECEPTVAHAVQRAAIAYHLDSVHYIALIRSVGDLCDPF